MSQHTPGPWKVDVLFNRITQVIGQDPDFNAPYSSIIADVLAPNAQANARLIAKAPEMYDRLVELSDSVRSFLAMNPEQHDLVIAETKACALLREIEEE